MCLLTGQERSAHPFRAVLPYLEGSIPSCALHTCGELSPVPRPTGVSPCAEGCVICAFLDGHCVKNEQLYVCMYFVADHLKCQI